MLMRNEQILSLRPSLNLPETETGVHEHFQNNTLRPILKYQHDLLVLIFKNYIEKRKNTFHALSKPQKLSYIEQAVKTDLKFKNRLLGVIIGHFTSEEFAIFSENETELLRRLTDLLVQRLQSVTNNF
jgi:hypothetical protein